MALPTVTVVYSVPVKGQTATNLAAALAAVPLPLRTLFDLGVYVVTDVTAAGPPATRTITLRINSADPPTATPNRVPGVDASGIESVNVTHIGSGLIRPPVFLPFDPASQTLQEWLAAPPPVDSPPGRGARFQSYMKVVGINAISGGAGYSNKTIATLVGGFPFGTASDVQRVGNGLEQAFLGSDGVGTRTNEPDTVVPSEQQNVRAISVVKPGLGYNPATTRVVFLGVPVAERFAFAIPTFDAMGRCTSVTVIDPGLYSKTPEVALADTSGAGNDCELGVNMVRGIPATINVTIGEGGTVSLALADGGDGYVAIPDAILYDPTGGGSGGAFTVGPRVGGAASKMGLSRVDVLNTGAAYTDPLLSERSFFEAQLLVAEAAGGSAKQTAALRFFDNLMTTAIQNALLTQVTEAVT